jgi:hypothetical protein
MVQPCLGRTEPGLPRVVGAAVGVQDLLEIALRSLAPPAPSIGGDGANDPGGGGAGRAGGGWRLLRGGLGVGGEDRVDQAGEARVEVGLAQPRVAAGALNPLRQNTRFTKNTQVVGKC